jgi:hypothetical protein
MKTLAFLFLCLAAGMVTVALDLPNQARAETSSRRDADSAHIHYGCR